MTKQKKNVSDCLKARRCLVIYYHSSFIIVSG